MGPCAGPRPVRRLVHGPGVEAAFLSGRGRWRQPLCGPPLHAPLRPLYSAHLTRGRQACALPSGARPCVGWLARGGSTGKGYDDGFPDFTMRQLLEAGVHFGHQTRRWNPKMAPYIFGVRNGVHIIDLTQTVPLLHQALRRSATSRPPAAACCSSAPSGRRGARRRRRQALRPVLRQPPLARRHADQLEDHLALDQAPARARGEAGRPATQQGLTKKELLELSRERDKLERALGGIKDMGGLPDMLFVIDTNKEEIAIQEANASSASRWSRSSTPTPIRTASTSRSRATTTPAAPISSTAICRRARCSTASGRDGGLGRRHRRASRTWAEIEELP